MLLAKVITYGGLAILVFTKIQLGIHKEIFVNKAPALTAIFKLVCTDLFLLLQAILKTALPSIHPPTHPAPDFSAQKMTICQFVVCFN